MPLHQKHPLDQNSEAQASNEANSQFGDGQTMGASELVDPQLDLTLFIDRDEELSRQVEYRVLQPFVEVFYRSQQRG